VPDDHTLVIIGYPKVESRSALRAVVSGGRNRGDGATTSSVIDLGPPAALPRNPTGEITVTIPTGEAPDPARLLLSTPGLFPFGVALRDKALGTAKNEQLGFVERLVDTDPRPPVTGIALGIFVAVDGRPSLQPAGTYDIDDQVTAKIDALIELLTDTRLVVDISIRPELLDGLALSGDPADQQRLTDLAAAIGTQHRVLTEPYVALDPSFAAASGLVEEFTDQLRRGDETINRRLGAIADRSVWLIKGGIDAGGIELLRNLGVQRFVGDSTVTSAVGAGVYPAAPTFGTVGESTEAIPVLISDPGLRASSVSPDLIGRAPTPALQQRLAIRTTAADLFALGLEIDVTDGAPRTLLITDDELTADDVSELDDLAAALVGNPRFSFESASDLITIRARPNGFIDPIEVALKAAALEPNLTTAELLIRLSDSITTTASMLPTGDPRVQRWTSLVAVLVSQELTDAQRDEYVTQLDGELGEIRDSISLPESPGFNLGGQETRIPLALENRSDIPLRVMVRLTSPNNKVEFTDNDIVVTVTDREELMVPVRVRSSGQTAVIVQVLTPEGPADNQELIGPTRLSVSRTLLSGIGQTVTFGFLGVLVLWWIQHARKIRRIRRSDVAHATATHPATTVLDL
jgi:hypothetical protein